jgi:hypothetical protein
MATFKNAAIAVGTTDTTVYTCPSGKTAIIHAVFFSNLTTNTITVSLKVYDNSVTTNFTLLKDIIIPANSSLQIEKPINLEASDVVKVSCNVASSSEVFLSVLEND